MKKTLMMIFAAMLFVAQTHAQQAWLTLHARELNFPSDEYVTGFAQASLRAGETSAEACDRVGREAAKQAAASIRTMIETTTEMRNTETEKNGNFDFMSVYSDYTRQSANAEIAGLKTEVHFADNVANGFAFVKRSELANYYKMQIDLNLRKVEDAVANAQTAAAAGQKLKAKTQCEQALAAIADIEFAQNLLTAVNPTDKNALQSERVSTAKNQLFQKLIDLEQSIYVYVVADEVNFGTPTTILANRLKSVLAKNQCSFTTDKAQADYVVSLSATTRKHDVDNPNFKFAYADVSVDLFSSFKQMSIFNDEMSVKAGAMTFDTAGKKALEEAAQQVWTKIEPWIKR